MTFELLTVVSHKDARITPGILAETLQKALEAAGFQVEKAQAKQVLGVSGHPKSKGKK